MTTRISVNAKDLEEVHGLIASGKKIQAIKLVRSVGRFVDLSHKGKPGLKDAKLAVDSLCHGNVTSHQLISDWNVHSLVVSGPAGEKIQVDLKTLQLHFLTTLASVGITEVNRLLDLVDFVRQWQGETPVTHRQILSEEGEDKSESR